MNVLHNTFNIEDKNNIKTHFNKNRIKISNKKLSKNVKNKD